MKRLVKLQRSYQIFPCRKLDTTKNRDVIRLYTMSFGGFFLARNAAGDAPSVLATDWTVRLAPRSDARKRRPYPVSGLPASSEKIEVGMSTEAPLSGIWKRIQ